MSNVQLPKVAYSPTPFFGYSQISVFWMDYGFLNSLRIVFPVEQFKIKLFFICIYGSFICTCSSYPSFSKAITAFYLSVNWTISNNLAVLNYFVSSALLLFSEFVFQLRSCVDSNDLTFPIACWQNLQCTSIRVGPRQTAYGGGLQHPSFG